MRRLRLLLMGGFGLLIGVLAIRLIIVASGTETGADGLLMTWRDASVGQIVGPSVPVSQRTAAEQAEFWLAETDRILADAPDDAELIMGAAIVLASPTMDAIWGRNTTFEALTSGFGPIPRTDYEAIEKESRQFDERCRQRCLDLAEKATTLEPDNPIWWRLRAALQFRGSGLSQIDEPRNPNWPAVLEEAVGHDPDNALYDYLAVFTLWEAAFKVEYDASHNCLITIQDPDGFARAETHIDRAQTKSLIRGYASGMSAVDKLLARANLWSTDCSAIAGGRLAELSLMGPLARTWRWLPWQAADMRPPLEPAEQLALHEKSLLLLDQCRDPELGSLDVLLFVAHFRRGACQSIGTLLAKHPGLLTAEERTALEGRCKQAVLRDLVVELAVRRVMRANTTNVPRTGPTIALVFAHAIASRAVAVLVFLAIVFWCMARLVFRTDEGAIAKVGIWAMIVTWFLGIAASLIVWGIFPAEIISPRVQGWMVLLAIGTLALIAILVGMLRWLRWRRFQYTIAEALIGMTVFALLCGVLSMTGPLWGDPDDLASRFEIAPKGIDFFPPDVLKTGLSQSHADWAWPVAQWFYHGGPYWAVGLALTLLGCWFWIRSTRANRKTAESDRRPRLACRRVFWAALLRCLARSSWGMAVVQLIVFLAVAPDMVRLAENNYQNTMRWARDAESHCEAVQVEVDKIERDQAAMKLLEQETQDLFVP